MKAISDGRVLVKALKNSAGDPKASLSLSVGTPPVARLRPVGTHSGRIAPRDVANLTRWRNRFVHSFLTQFRATEPRTKEWLTRIVGPDNGRILFMADDLRGRTFGYLGLAFIDWKNRSGEADAIVRGGPARKGTMRKALATLLAFAQGSLGLTRLGVRVRADNPGALRFYRSLGFKETRRVPVQRLGTALVHMRLVRRAGSRA